VFSLLLWLTITLFGCCNPFFSVFLHFYFCLIFNRICRKIIGLGFAFGPNTYLKNSWNWLDFSVVIIGYLSFVGVNNLSALRTFRVLRPLRTLTTVPGMKVIVVSMISALPALSGVSQTTDPLLIRNEQKQTTTDPPLCFSFFFTCCVLATGGRAYVGYVFCVVSHWTSIVGWRYGKSLLLPTDAAI
jgi:hypothetical protein